MSKNRRHNAAPVTTKALTPESRKRSRADAELERGRAARERAAKAHEAEQGALRVGRREHVTDERYDRTQTAMQDALDTSTGIFGYAGKVVEGDYSSSDAHVLYDGRGDPAIKEAFLNSLSPIRADVDMALKRLKDQHPRHYQAIIDHDKYEIPLQDIAINLGVSLATAYNYRSHGLAFIRGYIAAESKRRKVG